MKMNVQRSLWLALPIALLFPVGCNDATGAGQSAEAVAAAPAAQETPAAREGRHHGRHHHQGPARMLFHAARSLDLTDAQRSTIDQLSQQLRGNRGGDQGAARAALVEGVRAGNVDVTRVESLQATGGQARQAHQARESAALNGLWAALQPAQRLALVSQVREKQAERAERRAGHQHAAGDWQKQKLAHLTTQLDLDAAQQVTVEGLLAKGERPSPAAMQAKREEAQKRNDALLTAFASDSFDAAKLAPSASPEGRMGFAQHRAEFLAQLVPVLRADQREKLASSMENRRL
jgi:Spy/CpxP family protein refolding chaperone